MLIAVLLRYVPFASKFSIWGLVYLPSVSWSSALIGQNNLQIVPCLRIKFSTSMFYQYQPRDVTIPFQVTLYCPCLYYWPWYFTLAGRESCISKSYKLGLPIRRSIQHLGRLVCATLMTRAFIPPLIISCRFYPTKSDAVFSCEFIIKSEWPRSSFYTTTRYQVTFDLGFGA